MSKSLVGASRSADMSRRRFDLGAMAGLAGDKKDEEEVVEKEEEDPKESMWSILMSGYTAQLDRLGNEIGARKNYYYDDSLEAFYIEQIKERLLKFSEILSESVSISDLATRLDSNQAIIPAIKNNIADVADQLSYLIRASYEDDNKDSSSWGRGGRNGRSNNSRRTGSSYPGSIMNESNNRY